MGYKSLLQGIFLTLEKNKHLPDCRWILSQLSYLLLLLLSHFNRVQLCVTP